MTENVRHISKPEENPPLPMQNRTTKRWMQAKRYFGKTRRQHDNEAIELHFMNMLHRIKQLVKEDQPTVFERDFRYDTSQGAFGMHSFMTDSIYLDLSCALNYLYEVEFAFYQCRHEQAIRKMLDAFILQGRVKEVTLKPDFPTHFKNMLAYQPEKYIYSL